MPRKTLKQRRERDAAKLDGLQQQEEDNRIRQYLSD